jgi:hypothetical protein
MFSREKVVVADRFMLDALVDVAYDTRLNPIKHVIGRFFLLTLSRLMRKGRVRGVVMHVDESTVFIRRRDIPGRAYVTFRIPIYVSLASWLGIPIIDGRNDVAKNFLEIVKALGVASV